MKTKSRLTILMIFFSALSLNLIAQNSFLEINKTDNSVYRLELSTLNKITFSGTDMKLNMISGEINTIATAAIRTMIFKNSTGLNLNQTGNQIKIFPNPTTENIGFRGLKSENPVVNIYSVTGQLMLSHALESSQDLVSVTGLQSGIYFVNIENHLIRFIKK